MIYNNIIDETNKFNEIPVENKLEHENTSNLTTINITMTLINGYTQEQK